MMSSPKRIIIAADFGGTKGDILIVDADSGKLLKRSQNDFMDMPPEIVAKAVASWSGLGRSVEMGSYCLGQALDGIRPKEAFLVYNGLKFDRGVLSSLGIELRDKILVIEEDGIMAAEELQEGVCVILGTGATSAVYMKGRKPFLIDAYGPLCGDWGGGYQIGRNFVRNALREQNFTEDVLSETQEILTFLQSVVTGYDVILSNPLGNCDATWKIIGILLQRENRSIVAALAKVCDACARKGSRLAIDVLEDAGREAAENVRRGAVHVGIDGMERIPVLASGSVLLHSDFVYDSFRRNVTASLPNAEVWRSRKSQTYGQTLIMLKTLHGQAAAAKIERFKAEFEAIGH